MCTRVSGWQVLVLGSLALFLAGSVDAGQPAGVDDPSLSPDVRQLQTRIQEQWQLVPLQDGVLLVPRRPGRSFKGVELRRGGVAIDGLPVTGTELTARLGVDADLVLQLSYLDGATLTRLARPPVAPTVESSRREAEHGAPVASVDAQVAEPQRTVSRRRSARVRIGSDLVIDEDEYVEDAAVAILGSVIVNGEVNGDVAAVGGDVRLGPHAAVRGDVTAVGGTIVTHAGAQLLGDAHEVAIRLPRFTVHMPSPSGWSERLWPGERWFAGLALGWSALRMTFIGLLTLIVAIVAGGPVGRIRTQVARAPLASGLVGLAAQLLLVPAVVAVALVLLVSVVGIPLLALMPLVLLAIGVFWVTGLAAVAQVVGGWLPGLRERAGASVVAGLTLIWLCSLTARALWWSGAAGLAVPTVLGAAGLAVEFIAWTIALGAALLAWARPLGHDRVPAVPAVPPVPSAPAQL